VLTCPPNRVILRSSYPSAECNKTLEQVKEESMLSTQTHALGSPSDWGAEVSLEEVDFAKLFVSLIERRKTISLVVTPSAETDCWRLSLSEGELKGISSQYNDEALLTELVAHSALSAELVERAQRREDEDLIEWLLERDLVKPRALRVAQQAVGMRHLNRLFALSDGKVIFEAYQRPTDPITLPLPSLRLAVHGVYKGYDRLRLYERFGSLKSRPRAKPNGLFRSGLTELERELLSHARGEQTVAQIAQELGADPLFALSFYYVFSLLSELQLLVTSPLGDLYERAISEDYFKLLGVSVSASTDEVAQAWRALRAQVAEIGADSTEEGREVIEILKDAHLVLTHPHLRARYLESSRRPVALRGQVEEQSFTTPVRPLALGPATRGATQLLP